MPVAVPAIAKTIHEPADLLNATLLHDEANAWDPAFPDWETWLMSLGVEFDKPLRLRYFGDSNITIQAAMSGSGVALVWRSLVVDELRAGRLVQLFGQSLSTNNRYHLLTTPNRFSLPKVMAFREWLMSQTQVSRAPT